MTHLTLQQWTETVQRALGTDIEVDIDLVLDLARDAAHSVARPAAPLTTFLLGYAAARRAGTPADVAEIAAIISRLCAALPDERG
jgi:hypothetical protein